MSAFPEAAVPRQPLPRPAADVMDPVRLAAMQPNRLSASRSLIELMRREGWAIDLTSMDVDGEGAGTACYRIRTKRGILSFVVFSFRPSMVDRTPRIIGQSWDMVGALLEGEADSARIEHTRAEMPKLYAGRAAPGTLVWCRSNRSLRAFDLTVRALAEQRQPDARSLTEIGYLMRNTGLDGNGTFGTKSFLAYGDDHPLRTPYHAQMLAAYLMREFSFDLCDALARRRSSSAAALSPQWREYLGLGNGSALGLVLFVGNHPRLIDQWLRLREEALLFARRLSPEPGDPRYERLAAMLLRVARYRDDDPASYGIFPQSEVIAAELRAVADLVGELARDGGFGGRAEPFPLEALRRRVAGAVTPETEETLDALLTELVPEICDGLLSRLVVNEQLVGDPGMEVGELRGILDREYRWAVELPMAEAERRRRIWYKSRSSEEPRSGPAEEVPGGFDLSMDVPGAVHRVRDLLAEYDPATRVGRVLADHPHLRADVERFQALRDAEYAHPRMDILDVDFVPARCIRLINGALYGLDRTKDYLNRTLRGLMFQGAPSRAGLVGGSGEWWAPPEPGAPLGSAE